jgi:ABC-type glycerol-3-phosphate transport system substrate-binding protein
MAFPRHEIAIYCDVHSGSRGIDLGRRAAIGALACGAAGFAVFGPRGAKEAAGSRIVLDYWEKWTGGEGTAMRQVVSQFNSSQDRIFVRYLSMAGIDQKAMIAIAGGDPPDIVGLWNYSIPVFSEANAILPLDDLTNPYPHMALSQYAPGVRPIMMHNGKRWGAINTSGTLALYYNRTIFKEAGLDPDRPPRTISEFNECVKALTSRGPAGFMITEPGWWTWVWGYHFGGAMWNPSTEDSTIAGPEFIKAYDWVQQGVKDLGLQPSIAFQESFGTYDTPDNAFLAGKVAMIFQGPWIANVIKAFKPDLDYGVAPFPVDDHLYRADAPVACIDTDILVIPRGVKHPEASMEFIAYTQTQPVVEHLAKVHAKGSPILDVSEDFVRTHPNRGVAVHNALASSPRAFLCPRTRAWTQLKAEFDAMFVPIRRLDRPAATILKEIQDRSQAILDRNAATRARRGGPEKGRLPPGKASERGGKIDA